MVYDENSRGQQDQNPSDETSNEEHKTGDNNEVLDTVGSSQTSRAGRKPRETWEGERMTFRENGNSVDVVISRTENRYYRLEFYINGNVVRPVTLPGMSPAQSYWEMLKTHVKEVNQHVGDV